MTNAFAAVLSTLNIPQNIFGRVCYLVLNCGYCQLSFFVTATFNTIDKYATFFEVGHIDKWDVFATTGYNPLRGNVRERQIRMAEHMRSME